MKNQPLDTHVQTETNKTPEIEKLFRAVIKADASDLHLKVNMPPKIRVHSKLKSTTGDPLTEEKIERMVFEIMSEDQKQFFLKNGALDFAYQVGDMDRFRINVFRQRSYISLAARRISGRIPPFESLHLPPIVEKIAESHDGLILVVGPTGCGKSTTIASMIDHINRLYACHIVTIEDPIEFLHVDKKAIVSQREIGIDVPSYEEALRSLMRQDPDVVLVGEMRDQETLTAAMRAAETGHLVFGTLHSNNCSQTIQRILDLFPQEERDLMRQTFALTIRAIIAQQLLPGIRPDVPRVPAVEIMINTPIIRKLISDQREADLPTAIRAGEGEGMQDFTESLRRLVEEEFIDLKVALQYAPNVEELKMALKGIRSTASGIL
ncbi:MAG TPA: PilT/PilU family type 4a pilus ATPase [Anaerohalosphaeraceae bacterium]|nr:PilT/PilU family type 4a pilus ATPase [Phycisphaerae bacterium]HOK95840.1 PilT/PilU family type 4a pilus ATPase [Anaerohalosphaeraceae bacterium]HOL30435.1 PilT/PilU family type 4a pilus ATPase [Anaerohalosphaeraceae bacterium]HOM75820.1 PilT/PilU family type 4a pilus ATPase [Anaerohalosphaeraceae bacterium]HPC64096.1 PilT/PilU family type 4a pilus ATPase [Anaerohalosphaeraceae bacterium]